MDTSEYDKAKNKATHSTEAAQDTPNFGNRLLSEPPERLERTPELPCMTLVKTNFMVIVVIEVARKA